MRAADNRPLVPIQAEPAHAVEDAVDHLGGGSIGVSVLDPQHEDAAMPARQQPVEERGAGATDVQVTGRRGRETDAYHPLILEPVAPGRSSDAGAARAVNRPVRAPGTWHENASEHCAHGERSGSAISVCAVVDRDARHRPQERLAIAAA
jgi:hypothetical protein